MLSLHTESTDSITIMCHSLEVVLEGLLKEGPCNGGPPELQSDGRYTHTEITTSKIYCGNSTWLLSTSWHIITYSEHVLV